MSLLIDRRIMLSLAAGGMAAALGAGSAAAAAETAGAVADLTGSATASASGSGTAHLKPMSYSRATKGQHRAYGFLPTYLRRIVKYRQMDFEYSFWLMLQLCISPKTA